MSSSLTVASDLVRSFLTSKHRRDWSAAAYTRDQSFVSRDSEWQLEMVRLAWKDAVSDVPYYCNLVAKGEAPNEISSWDDVSHIPVLSREIVQEHFSSFERRSREPQSIVKTAGSTGTPLKLGVDQSERDLMRIVKIAAWQQFGYSPDSRLFLIWGHSHLLGTGWRGRVNHVRRKLADWALGYQRVDAYRLNRVLCERYAEQLIQFRPLGLIGYASALDLFASHTARWRERFRELGLRFVLATSEPPPREDSFARLEDLFGCPVVQEYGGAEFGQVAFNSGHGRFEVYSDLNYIEIEPDSEPGSGSVLITSLYPRYVPLFRYRVNDRIVGANVLPHGHVGGFAKVEGRVNDVIELEGGDAIHSVAVFHCIHQEPVIRNIQMVISDDGIEILLASHLPDDASTTERIRERLRQVHPVLASATIKYTEDLVTNRAGKRRWFIDRRTKTSNAARSSAV